MAEPFIAAEPAGRRQGREGGESAALELALLAYHLRMGSWPSQSADPRHGAQGDQDQGLGPRWWLLSPFAVILMRRIGRVGRR